MVCSGMCKSAEELGVWSRNPKLQMFASDTTELPKPKSVFTWRWGRDWFINKSVIRLLPPALEVPRTISLGSKEFTVEDRKCKLRKQVASTDSYEMSSCWEKLFSSSRKTQVFHIQTFARLSLQCFGCCRQSDTDKIISLLHSDNVFYTNKETAEAWMKWQIQY